VVLTYEHSRTLDATLSYSQFYAGAYIRLWPEGEQIGQLERFAAAVVPGVARGRCARACMPDGGRGR
jgi:hypothetical protein